MKYHKNRWANIVCNERLEPRFLIVTDRYFTIETSVEHSTLRVAKKAALDVYGVPPAHILVTKVLEPEHDDKDC